MVSAFSIKSTAFLNYEHVYIRITIYIYIYIILMGENTVIFIAFERW